MTSVAALPIESEHEHEYEDGSASDHSPPITRHYFCGFFLKTSSQFVPLGDFTSLWAGLSAVTGTAFGAGLLAVAGCATLAEEIVE